MTQNLPLKMRAAAIDRFGGINELRTQTVDVPPLEADEVLVRVTYAGVGTWDTGEREGRYSGLYKDLYGADPTFPYVIGFDGAGVIEAVGGDVEGFAPGDRVYADRHLNPKGGFYAEFAVVAAPHVHHTPTNLSDAQAGALPVDAITALLGLTENLELKGGESLLVFGASGGLGHMAVQLAKILGARVFAVASGRDGVEFARRCGADAAVDGRTDDVAYAAAAFAPDGFDKALLTAGGEAAEAALELVKDHGVAAFPRGVDPEPQPPAGIELRRYIGDAPSAARWEQLTSMISAGPFEVHVAQEFGLDDATAAHEALLSHHLGKLALRVQNS